MQIHPENVSPCHNMFSVSCRRMAKPIPSLPYLPGMLDCVCWGPMRDASMPFFFLGLCFWKANEALLLPDAGVELHSWANSQCLLYSMTCLKWHASPKEGGDQLSSEERREPDPHSPDQAALSPTSLEFSTRLRGWPSGSNPWVKNNVQGPQSISKSVQTWTFRYNFAKIVTKHPPGNSWSNSYKVSQRGVVGTFQTISITDDASWQGSSSVTSSVSHVNCA